MITEISSQYNVDIDRIYAAGYLNGGMMTYGLSNYKSVLIAAVASVSGAMLECIGSNIHPMVVIHLHGTSDGVLPYNGSIDWNATQSTLYHRINFSSTVLTPTITSDNNIERHVYD